MGWKTGRRDRRWMTSPDPIDDGGAGRGVLRPMPGWIVDLDRGAAVPLGPEERGVGGREQLAGFGGHQRRRRHAGREGQRPAQRAGVAGAEGGLEQALGEDEAAGRVGMRHDDGELVAADPVGAIGRADGGRHQGAEAAQQLVGGAVAGGVVDPLEVVEIDEHQRGRGAVAPGELGLAGGCLLPRPMIAEARQRIGQGVDLGPLVEPSQLDARPLQLGRRSHDLAGHPDDEHEEHADQRRQRNEQMQGQVAGRSGNDQRPVTEGRGGLAERREADAPAIREERGDHLAGAIEGSEDGAIEAWQAGRRDVGGIAGRGTTVRDDVAAGGVDDERVATVRAGRRAGREESDERDLEGDHADRRVRHHRRSASRARRADPRRGLRRASSGPPHRRAARARRPVGSATRRQRPASSRGSARHHGRGSAPSHRRR